MGLESVYPDVRCVLESWGGFQALSRVLDEVEDLEVFLAGGIVRNCVLGTTRRSKDFDLFFKGASFDRALDILGRHGSMTHSAFGSPRWFPAEDPTRYADLIPIEDFRPGLWPCEDILDVLDQFDFTGNALAFDLRRGTSFDPQNGARDLARRTMRMVRFDYPEALFVPGHPISRNAVLWFRVLHYARLLDLAVEPVTLEWLRTHRRYQCGADVFNSVFFRPADGYLRAVEDG